MGTIQIGGREVTVFEHAGRLGVAGCDVSKWQGDINYAVFDSGFVLDKATGGDGGLYVDGKWVRNCGGFAAVGVAEGPYHFAGRDDPVKEADFFCSVILDSAWVDLAKVGLQLPPMLDAEWANPHFGPGAADWSLRFLGHVEDRVQVHPIIYSAGWVGLEPNPALLDYALALAAYVDNPDGYPCPPWGTNWSLWQDSDHGSITGIPGGVDTDFARVDWITSVLGSTPSPPPAQGAFGMEIWHFTDSDDLYVYGVAADGDWCKKAWLSNDEPAPEGFVSIDPELVETLPRRPLAVGPDQGGSEERDARFHRLTGA